MKFHYIASKTSQYPVAWMCRLLRVSRSGYYASLHRKPSKREKHDVYLSARIRALFEEYKHCYGSPRICDELKADGEHVGRKRVIRLMQQQGLCARLPKRFRNTTDSDHNFAIAPNSVDRNFSPDDLNKLWATDISYVRTWQGWVYLAVVIDLYSRRVVGWSVDNHMRTDLPLDALKMAVKLRRPAVGLVHHSDRGSQYASDDYQDYLKDNNIDCSMSRKGNCWDNSCVESFFATIKKELIYRHTWASAAVVIAAIDQYMLFYNTQRRHSTLGSRSPIEYELLTATKKFRTAA